MFDRIRVLFFTVELNLVFWLIALGSAFHAGVRGWPLWSIIVGVLFAALWQHQAYYRRKRESSENQAESTLQLHKSAPFTDDCAHNLRGFLAFESTFDCHAGVHRW